MGCPRWRSLPAAGLGFGLRSGLRLRLPSQASVDGLALGPRRARLRVTTVGRRGASSGCLLGLGRILQKFAQIRAGRERDGHLGRDDHRRAVVRIADLARIAPLLREGPETWISELSGLAAAPAANEEVADLDENGVHQLGDRLFRETPRDVLP